MKQLVLIFVFLVVGLVAYLFFAERAWLEEMLSPEKSPAPAAVSESSPDAPVPSKAPPRPQAKTPRSLAKIQLPETDMSLFLDGEPVTPGETVEWERSSAVLLAFDGKTFDHQVLALAEEQTFSPTLTKREPKGSPAWNTFQGNALRSGYVEAPGKDNLKLQWQQSLGDEVKSSPIVLGDTVYFSSDNRLVNAVDLQTGKTLWSQGEIGATVSPIATEKFIFMGNDLGVFAGYRLQDGKKRGEKALGSYPTSLSRISEEAFLATTRDQRVFSIQTKRRFTGRLPLRINWEISLPELGQSTASPIIQGNQAVFRGSGNALTAIDLTSGKKLWSKGTQSGSNAMQGDMQLAIAEPDSFLTSTPAAGNGKLFAVMDNHLVAFALNNGEELWRQALAAKVTSSLSLAYGMIVAGCADGSLRTFSTAAGQPVYTASLSSAPIFASPVVFGGRILVATEQGELLLLHAFTGALLAKDQTLAGAPIKSTPAVAGERIFAVNEKGEMASFR